MVGGISEIPPRNGEGDHAEHGGGVLSASDAAFKLAKKERRTGNLPEVVLWRELRKRPGGYKFRRQHPIGECVLDFACLERRLALEVDGMAHDLGDRPERDRRRDGFLQSRGFDVLRIRATDILANLDVVIVAIVDACDRRVPLHHAASRRGPPPRAGEVLR